MVLLLLLISAWSSKNAELSPRHSLNSESTWPFLLIVLSLARLNLQTTLIPWDRNSTCPSTGKSARNSSDNDSDLLAFNYKIHQNYLSAAINKSPLLPSQHNDLSSGGRTSKRQFLFLGPDRSDPKNTFLFARWRIIRASGPGFVSVPTKSEAAAILLTILPVQSLFCFTYQQRQSFSGSAHSVYARPFAGWRIAENDRREERN